MKDDLDIPRRLNRYRQFYQAADNGWFLIITTFPGKADLISFDLRTFDFTRQSEHQRYWDGLVEQAFYCIEDHIGVDDDWIPGIVLHYGFGAFGMVYADAALTFTEDTCYMESVLPDWSQKEKFAYSPDRFWSQIFIQAAHYLSEKGYGCFMVDSYPNPSPLDVVNLLRGNLLFTDFYEYPETLTAFLKQVTEWVIENAKMVYGAMHHAWEGRLTFNAWIPDGILLLEDAADLCSPAVYRKFGFPYTRQVLHEMGGGYIHHHSLGRQQYRNMASLDDLYVLQISSDPAATRPLSELPYLFEQVGNKPVDLECTVDEIVHQIDQLRKGRAILRASCENKEEAQWLVRFVREKSKKFNPA